MAAKDTVVPTLKGEITACPTCGMEIDISIEIAYERVTQAEISFEAGKQFAETAILHNLLDIIEASKQVSKREVVELSLQAIADEPEFPGDMPDELWVELNGNRFNTLLSMRNSVRLTKKGITERLQALLKEAAEADGHDD